MITNWDQYGLAPIPAIIIAPQAPSKDSHWHTGQINLSIKAMIQYVSEAYNASTEANALAGHSMGGGGAMFVFSGLKDTFKTLVVMSKGDGYIGHAEDYYNIRMRGYDEDCTLEKVFKWAHHENDFVCLKGMKHEEVPIYAFTTDADGDGESDLIHWMFEEYYKNYNPGGSGGSSDSGENNNSGDSDDSGESNNSQYNSKSTILADALDKTLNANINFDKSGNILLFGSDYQGLKVRKEKFSGILENINNNNISPNLIMLLGDYVDANEQSTSKIGVEEANSIIRSYKNFNNSGTLYLQGNHDSIKTNNYLIKTGPYETDNYIIYAINYDDFHCSAHNTCTDLDEYLNSLVNSKSNKPIFVVSHLPLHATSRESNRDAYLTVDTLNKYGDVLDIIVMFAHNHSGTYDRCNGGTTTYFAKGSTMEVRKNSQIITDTIKFTYLNAGYVASVSSSFVNGTVNCNGVLKESSNELTMTLFTINNSSIIVDRYSKNAKLSSNIINRNKN
jgi:UDP-2,3-diacylglucosamine pyrophosphatase LpxH